MDVGVGDVFNIARVIVCFNLVKKAAKHCMRSNVLV